MNQAQQQIYNMIVENMRLGIRTVLFMPRKMGATALKKAVEKEVAKVKK